MHDIIHRELQKARVADLHLRAQQDRLAREAARHWRRQALGRVLAVLSARRFALRPAATTSTAPIPSRSTAPTFGSPASTVSR
jgi:hypothetical protein